MKIICQIGVVFAVCWVSQLIEAALPFPFPPASSAWSCCCSCWPPAC